MAKTKIEWATYTFNPWVGCTKISPACDNCYAADYGNRFGVEWGANKPRKRTSMSNWELPLRWNKQARIKQKAWQGFKNQYPDLTDEQLIERGFIKPERPRVFCASLADVFDNEVPDEWRVHLFWLMSETPNLDWLILTKRIGNAEKMIKNTLEKRLFLASTLNNIWLGSTICNQEEADRDIPKLLSVPAAKHFLSIEPMLGKITLELRCKRDHNGDGDCDRHPNGCPRIDWVICGGESGKNARPMHPAWVSSLRNQCTKAGVPFLFKQWGEWVPRSNCYHTFSDGQSCSDIDPSCTRWPNVIKLTKSGTNGRLLENSDDGETAFMQRVGKKTAGRLLNGREHNEFPISISEGGA